MFCARADLTKCQAQFAVGARRAATVYRGSTFLPLGPYLSAIVRAHAAVRFQPSPDRHTASGGNSPSEADSNVARDLNRARQFLKSQILDHVIY
jgi:hypothetical protein